MPSWMRMESMAQSAADGSLNAAMACFSEETESGDFYMPGKGATGPPKKTLSKGLPVESGGEKDTVNEENQKIAFEGCQKALGVEFVVYLKWMI
jgi:hypothetical protein